MHYTYGSLSWLDLNNNLSYRDFMSYLLQLIGVSLMKNLILGWLVEWLFDSIVNYAQALAKRSDTTIDDDLVLKFRDNRAKFIALAKGKL